MGAEEAFGLLRTVSNIQPETIKRVSDRKRESFTRKRILSLCWYGEHPAVISIFTAAGWNSYRLEELRPGEVEAIKAFVIGRINEPPHTSLAALHGRDRRDYRVGLPVVTQASALSKRCSGKLLWHAADNHAKHLGDCWLVEYSSARYYLPAEQIYLAAEFKVISIH